MLFEATPSVNKSIKLGSRGFAHYAVHLVIITVIAISGTLCVVGSSAAAPAKKKNITLKVVTRKLPNCHFKISAQLDFHKAGEGYMDEARLANPTTKCAHVKNGSQTYYRTTMTFKFNNIPVYSKSKVKLPDPANRYTLYYTLPTSGTRSRTIVNRLKLQDLDTTSNYRIQEDSNVIDGTTGELRSPDFEKLSSRAINLEVY